METNGWDIFCPFFLFSFLHFALLFSVSSFCLNCDDFLRLSSILFTNCYWFFSFSLSRCTRNKLHNIWYSQHLLLPAIKWWKCENRLAKDERRTKKRKKTKKKKRRIVWRMKSVFFLLIIFRCLGSDLELSSQLTGVRC